MLVTIIHNSESNVSVHRAGCADIKRRELRDRGYLSHYNAEVTSEQEAANDAWSDFIGEGSMTEAQALSYTYVYPCATDAGLIASRSL